MKVFSILMVVLCGLFDVVLSFVSDRGDDTRKLKKASNVLMVASCVLCVVVNRGFIALY